MADTFRLDPDSTLDFAWDWTGWLGASETITSHTVTGSGVTVDSSSESAGVVTAWLSAATGPQASATCQVVTNEGRTEDRTITLQVVER